MTIKQLGIEFDIDENGYEGALADCPQCRCQVWGRVEWVQGAPWGTLKLVHTECDTEIVRWDRNDNIIERAA